MHLKIDSRQKIKYLRHYLSTLKSNSLSSPFMNVNVADCGFYDYQFITRRRKTINQIDKDLKDNKYQTVKQLCEDVKILYKNFSDYLLIDDPLQERIARLVREVGEFQGKFSQDFRLVKQVGKVSKKQQNTGTTKTKQNKQDPHPKPSNSNLAQSNPNPSQSQSQSQPAPLQPLIQFNRKSTFTQKLQFIFYMKSHQDNFQYIKSIGEGYNIGKQDIQTGEYMVRLDANVGGCLWLELLAKKQQ